MRATAAVAIVMAIGTGAGIAGAVSPAEKCAVAKQKAVGKELAAKMACVAKAKLQDAPVDASCLVKAEAKFSAAMAKAGGPCLGTPAAFESLADDCFAGFQGDVPGSGGCQSASARALGKAAQAVFACEAKDIRKPGTFADCRDGARDHLDAAIAKAGDCGQSHGLHDDVDTCLVTFFPIEDTTTSTTTTTTTLP